MIWIVLLVISFVVALVCTRNQHRQLRLASMSGERERELCFMAAGESLGFMFGFLVAMWATALVFTTFTN